MRRGTWVALTAVFPEVKLLAVPAIIWGVLAIACWQAVGVIALRLAVLSRDNGVDASADGWLRAMISFLCAFIVLVVSAFTALSVMGYATPGVMLGLIGGGLIAVIAAGSLVLIVANRPFMRLSSYR